MNANPEKEHQWLQKLVGEWTSEVEFPNESGELQKYTGTESVRSIGGLWIQGEGNGDMGNGPSTNIITLGYNPTIKKFVGTFVSSDMTHLWPYEGELDASGRSLHLDSEGPDMMGGSEGLVPYRDIVELVDNDHWILRGCGKGEDGSWAEFMATHYHRVK